MANNKIPSKYVITDVDEGVQINEGIRLGIAGCGYGLKDFSKVTAVLKKLFPNTLVMAASAQSDWMKDQLDLNDWEEINALAQQHIQALSDKTSLFYAGFFDFEDPKELKYGIKGHMVRPKDMHLANKICLTLGGGEQVYNLGQYLISADWVSDVPQSLAEKIIKQQVDFYQNLNQAQLKLVAQMGGSLGQKKAEQNKEVLTKMGFEIEIVE